LITKNPKSNLKSLVVNRLLKDEVKLESVWVRKSDVTTIDNKMPLDSYRKEKIVE
jgi:hypothetical protein